MENRRSRPISTWQHGEKGELSKKHIVKGTCIIETCFGFLHPIELVEISYSCKFPGKFLASFVIIIIIIKF